MQLRSGPRQESQAVLWPRWLAQGQGTSLSLLHTPTQSHNPKKKKEPDVLLYTQIREGRCFNTKAHITYLQPRKRWQCLIIGNLGSQNPVKSTFLYQK